MANAVLEIGPLGFPWQTADPFLFCVHHHDAYPRGNERLGPDYQRAHFGGWPWPSDDPVHGPEAGRFAKHAYGTVERFEDVARFERAGSAHRP